MIHIRALGNNQRMGLSPIAQHAETIGMGMSGQKYTSSFFGGNARPAGILSVKGELNKDSWARLKDMWQKLLAYFVVKKIKPCFCLQILTIKR